MAEMQQLTEHQRAAMVARFVEIQDVSMVSIEAELLTPNARVISQTGWHFTQEKHAAHHFDEENKLLCIVLTLITELIGSEKEEPQKLVRCSGKYVLIYSFNVTGGPPPEEREAFFSAFANINAVFNAWPFFRELVHSTLGRMGLQPIALPVYRITPPAAPQAPQAQQQLLSQSAPGAAEQSPAKAPQAPKHKTRDRSVG